ncbi:hypothetical protein MMC14_001081 [Varicellaria rhodocarpa]|nr:hypothetical protein [Varicellaria rhodocarpa]
MYLRLFHTKPYRYAVYGLAGIIISVFIVGVLMVTFSCRPVAYLWDKTILGGKCIDLTLYYRWINFPNIVTDVVMLVLPQKAIWELNASRSQKIGLTLIFITGSVYVRSSDHSFISVLQLTRISSDYRGLVTSIFRFVSLITLPISNNVVISTTPVIWTMVEPAVYLISACLPTLRPLFSRLSKAASDFTKNALKANGYSPSIAAPNIQLTTTRCFASKTPGGGAQEGRFQRLRDRKERYGDPNDIEGQSNGLSSSSRPEIDNYAEGERALGIERPVKAQIRVTREYSVTR